ncbi:MAG TPA: sulfur transferase domain-containing protein [Planctomycetota bacterium]|nr:sulfur transferase domain-containing protein [Planctomycetota bacterium]
MPVPPPSATQPVQMEGLHNVVTYVPNLVCGGVPEGDEGMATLAAMGVKTIVSVDGAAPDVAAAERRGLHYVHLPVTYDTITPERQKELAQAISSCEGPIYVHCHHGKHRSAAALGSALVLAGKLTPAQAEVRMHVSGTAKDYTGLWQAVETAKPLPAAELVVDAARFPSVSKVRGMVATMAEIDSVFDLVRQAQKAGWKPPEEHPDLVAAHETRRLHTLFAQLPGDPDSSKHPADYQAKLSAMIDTCEQLDTAVRGGDGAAADGLLTKVHTSCKDCHKTYRDN